MTSIYLASRFSHKPQMQAHAADLAHDGIVVTSRWMRADYRWNGVPEDAINEYELALCAMDDLDDIAAADVLVCFTEHPSAGHTSGGRHVEAGYALGLGKPILVVGPRENIFYGLPGVAQVPDWDTARAWLRDYAESMGERT